MFVSVVEKASAENVFKVANTLDNYIRNLKLGWVKIYGLQEGDGLAKIIGKPKFYNLCPIVCIAFGCLLALPLLVLPNLWRQKLPVGFFLTKAAWWNPNFCQRSTIPYDKDKILIKINTIISCILDKYKDRGVALLACLCAIKANRFDVLEYFLRDENMRNSLKCFFDEDRINVILLRCVIFGHGKIDERILQLLINQVFSDAFIEKFTRVLIALAHCAEQDELVRMICNNKRILDHPAFEQDWFNPDEFPMINVSLALGY